MHSLLMVVNLLPDDAKRYLLAHPRFLHVLDTDRHSVQNCEDSGTSSRSLDPSTWMNRQCPVSPSAIGYVFVYTFLATMILNHLH